MHAAPSELDHLPDDIAMYAIRLDVHNGDLQAVKAFRPHVGPSQRTGVLLLTLVDVEHMTPEHLAVADELLSDYPGIDAEGLGPLFVENAAHAGNLALTAHLFPRFGASMNCSTADLAKMPTAAGVLVRALVEQRQMSMTMPGAEVPVQRSQARRL